jgi:hypothetical protein
MDTKLRSILAIALRPETTEGEAAAAMAAARRMVAKSGFDTLVGADGAERIVHRDRVVYRRASNGNCSKTMTITISPTYQFSMIERISMDAVELGLDVEVISCKGVDNSVHNGMVIKINVIGKEGNIEWYTNRMHGYINHARAENDQRAQAKESYKPKPAPRSREKSWWDILKEWA